MHVRGSVRVARGRDVGSVLISACIIGSPGLPEARHTEVDGGRLFLCRCAAGFGPGSGKQRLDKQPQFIRNDPLPRADSFPPPDQRPDQPTVTPCTASVRTS